MDTYVHISPVKTADFRRLHRRGAEAQRKGYLFSNPCASAPPQGEAALCRGKLAASGHLAEKRNHCRKRPKPAARNSQDHLQAKRSGRSRK